MTVVKSKEIVFRVPVFFREKKKKKEHFSKYINFKIEMNLCNVSFCGLYIAVSRNHSVQNSPWGGEGGL